MNIKLVEGLRKLIKVVVSQVIDRIVKIAGGSLIKEEIPHMTGNDNTRFFKNDVIRQPQSSIFDERRDFYHAGYPADAAAKKTLRKASFYASRG